MMCRSRRCQATNGPDWHFFGRPRMQNDSYYQGSYQGASAGTGRTTCHSSTDGAQSKRHCQRATDRLEEIPQVTYASYVAKDRSRRRHRAGSAGVCAEDRHGSGGGNYTYQDGRISYELASGGNGVISTDEVDWSTTTRREQPTRRASNAARRTSERRVHGILEQQSAIQHSAVSTSWRLFVA